MDVTEIKKAIERVIRRHSKIFAQIGSNQPKLLELGAITGLAEHYKACGYSVRVANPKGKRSFTVKTSSRGFPWNFSRIVAEKGGASVELHMNLMVRSAHDDGVYCVDVGITVANGVPVEKPTTDWICLNNIDLITFAEVKKIVVYPMLLAQFIGIVHEIKPSFLRGRKRLDRAHLSPVLIALGHFSGNASLIVEGYKRRGINVTIAENYDFRLARVRGRSAKSPFIDDEDSLTTTSTRTRASGA
jgi:hypothetical protein